MSEDPAEIVGNALNHLGMTLAQLTPEDLSVEDYDHYDDQIRQLNQQIESLEVSLEGVSQFAQRYQTLVTNWQGLKTNRRQTDDDDPEETVKATEAEDIEDGLVQSDAPEIEDDALNDDVEDGLVQENVYSITNQDDFSLEEVIYTAAPTEDNSLDEESIASEPKAEEPQPVPTEEPINLDTAKPIIKTAVLRQAAFKSVEINKVYMPSIFTGKRSAAPQNQNTKPTPSKVVIPPTFLKNEGNNSASGNSRPGKIVTPDVFKQQQENGPSRSNNSSPGKVHLPSIFTKKDKK